MKSSVILLTIDDALAERIVAILERLAVIHCRTEQDALTICGRQPVCLALVVDEPPMHDGCRLFARLAVLQPGLLGVLLTASVEKNLLCSAMEVGFSGLVELPVHAVHLNRVVEQALERFGLQRENTRLRTLIPLYQLGEQFASAATEQEILDGLLDAIGRQTEANHISVMLYDSNEDRLHIAAARGMDPALVRSVRLQPGDQIAGRVFQQGKPVILNREDQENSIFAPLLQQPDIVSAISFPLRVRQQIIGVVNISQKASDARFSEADNEMLAIICSQAAIAMEKVRALRELETTTRMRTLFEQYVAPEVAELLIARGDDPMDLGEIKEVTILFADIRNFTRLVQHIDLPMLRLFLNEFFQFFTEEVFFHQGTVDKFMGDAVLAVFGAPVKVGQPTLAAARTAWGIRRRFRMLRDQWIERCEGFQGLDLGIGLTCGPVFLGNVGSAQRLDYTVIGNDVNIAQRLAAESSACSIFTTETVQHDIAPWFACEDLGELLLRGMEKRVHVFSITEESGTIS
ncbi:GAF domain-containing protein [Desulfobulbus alkaliphilus]|uniref:GAF domain-containing protein n=1 Tax=Desulfobulbus alkaliphilus TaxID=869814 RepID=UPI001965B85C|nr:adenylate/guanylate cyclase domain-containing protein [Desulfobulbus alkaliphilus]MBM9537981.1 GAF domain-containing protein [Desulfobulbus alkaliphilus]